MAQTVIYLVGKNSPILYPAVLKNGWQRCWLNTRLAAVGAASGNRADDPVDVAAILHMRHLDQLEGIARLQPKNISRL